MGLITLIFASQANFQKNKEQNFFLHSRSKNKMINRQQLSFKMALVNLFLRSLNFFFSFFCQGVSSAQNHLQHWFCALVFVSCAKVQAIVTKTWERGTGTKHSNIHFLEIYLWPAFIVSSLPRRKSCIFLVFYSSVKGSAEIFLYMSLIQFLVTWWLFPV